MSKKYFKIIAFSMLFCIAAAQNALGTGSDCCQKCLSSHSSAPSAQTVIPAKQRGYIQCLKKCRGKICSTAGVPVDLKGTCHDCLCENLKDGKIDFSDNSPYSECITRNKNNTMCPDGENFDYTALKCPPK